MSLSSDELAALENGAVQIGIFFRLESSPVTRIWLGIGKCKGGINAIDTTEQNYFGAGELVNVPAFQQLVNGTAEVASFMLSGVNQQIVAIAAASASQIQGKRCYVGYGIMDSDWQLFAGVHWAWLTFADFVSVDQQPQPDLNAPIVRSISLSVSSMFTGRRRPRFSFLSDQDQQARSPGDKFCERMVLNSRSVSKKWPP